MHLHWERNPNVAGDCNIRSLSWMGRVPDEIPQEEGWKLNRNHYYQEGWLSTANLRGVVGVTYTTSHCGGSGIMEPSYDEGLNLLPPNRTNYNLRGHRAEVTLVRWNEPYQKLASCDTSGIIFVWIKYEGRWSIELINDRNTPVICFAWSHDGRMALICYQDGFVLVGSVAGQRFWSTLLPPDVNSITSGVWTPDDQYVYLGTSQGGLLVMDIHGNTVGRVCLREGVPVTELSWNCERFNMEEQQNDPYSDVNSQQPLFSQNYQNPFRESPGDSATHGTRNNKLNHRGDGSRINPNATAAPTYKSDGKPYVLAVCFKNGEILLMRTFDDIIPHTIQTGLQNFYVDWTNSGELLAVAGKFREIANRADHTIRYINVVHFYDEVGQLLYRSKVPSEMHPITSMTWGHNDKRIFVATGNHIHVGWVSPNVASLQLLSRLKIHKTLELKTQVEELPLPCRLQNLISTLFIQTIRCCIPDASDLRRFVIKPQPENVRIHCTMIKHGESFADELNALQPSHPLSSSSIGAGSTSATNFQTAASSYTLYMEHLGGFLPILKGKKVCKIRPEFVIFDPQLTGEEEMSNWYNLPLTTQTLSKRITHFNSRNDLSETDTDDELRSPRIRRRGRQRRNRRGPVQRYGFLGGTDSVDYANILPEESRLAEVSSNFWGTKFKMIGLDLKHLPPNLGQINYKASLLHLQPRQMTLEITDLKDENMEKSTNVREKASKEALDDWACLDDSSDDGWSEDNDDVMHIRKKRDRGVIYTNPSHKFEEDSQRKGVTMKDDILTAVKEDPIPTNVAPIAPLPSRLSFCLSPKQANNNHLETSISGKIPEYQNCNRALSPIKTPKASVLEFTCANPSQVISETALPGVPKGEISLHSPENKYSPTKIPNIFGDGPSASSGGVSLSTLAAVKRSPTVAPSISGRIVAKGNAIEIDSIESEIFNISSHIHDNITSIKLESPSKRCLKISMSCDNYLGEVKGTSISSRTTRKEDDIYDHINSPYHSCKGSPLKWAAKADELTHAGSGSNPMTSSLIVNSTTMSNNRNISDTGNTSIMTSSVTSPKHMQSVMPHQKSCSANQLDLIVDILGVPSDLLAQRDLNKRLFLHKEISHGSKYKPTTSIKHHQRHIKDPSVLNGIVDHQKPILRKCGKSKSCEDKSAPATQAAVVRRHKRAEAEAKRRSVYLKECKGRTESQKTCLQCSDTAQKVNDLDLNNEMFHVPTVSNVDKLESKEDVEIDTVTHKMETPSDVHLIEPMLEECKTSHPIFINQSVVDKNVIDAPNEIKISTEEESGELSDHCQFEDKEKLINLKKNKHTRKFDAVRALLEKTRKKLLRLTAPQDAEKRSHRSAKKTQYNTEVPKKPEDKLMKNRASYGTILSNENKKTQDDTLCSQSSPATPAEIRRGHPKGRNRSFSPVRALLNSPLIPRRMKGLRNKQAQETISGTVPGEHQRGKQSHLSSRQRPIKRPSDQNIDTEDQYSFNILLGEDSESDEENDECPFGRGLASSFHTTKEGNGAYHNLETFQKNQLKQKIKQYSTQNHPKPPSYLSVQKSGNDGNLKQAEVVISSPMTPLSRPFPSPPPAPNKRPQPRHLPNNPSRNITSVDDRDRPCTKQDLNLSCKLTIEDELSPLPIRKRNVELIDEHDIGRAKKSPATGSGTLSFARRLLPKTPNSTPFSTPFTKRKNQQIFHQYNQVHNIGGSTDMLDIPIRRSLVLHNKSPMWNEASQVYQLDFGGRVTQESAKNFQIEYKGRQVMQFGRIENNAYTLDFQYPFTAVQAFAVALANVTQRLK